MAGTGRPTRLPEPAEPTGAPGAAGSGPPAVEGGGRVPDGQVDRAGRLGSWAFAAAALLTCQLVAARYPVEWDGAQLVLGLDRLDVTNDTPHPPGYWLYLVAGRLVRAATPLDGTASLTLVASLAAAATVGLTHALGRAVGGRVLGAVAAALVLSSPFVWFYGASVDT